MLFCFNNIKPKLQQIPKHMFRYMVILAYDIYKWQLCLIATLLLIKLINVKPLAYRSQSSKLLITVYKGRAPYKYHQAREHHGVVYALEKIIVQSLIHISGKPPCRGECR